MPLIIDRFTGPPTEPVQEIPAMRARHPAAVAYDIYRTYRRWSPARPPCRPVTNRGATARRDRASKVGNNGRRLACPIDRPVPRVTVVIGSDGRYLRLPVSVPTRSDRYVPAAVPSPDITHFLGTCRPDGTPHAAGIGAQWLNGDLYFTSSPATRKARDLAVNPRCTISVRLAGIDLVLDGTAARVTDPHTLEQVAAG